MEHYHLAPRIEPASIGSELCEGLDTGKRLEAVLAVEAAVMLLESSTGDALRPGSPIMEIRLQRVQIASVFGAPRRCGRIAHAAAQAVHYCRKIVIVLLPVLSHGSIVKRPSGPDAPAVPHFAAFVIAAPQRYAGVISQAAHIVGGLVQNAPAELSLIRIDAAAEHEVLPDEHSGLVAERVEIIVFVNAASPHAQHVHAGGGSIAHDPLVLTLAYAGKENIVGNIVGAFHKHRHPVEQETETASLSVTLALQLYAAYSHPVGSGVQHGVSVKHLGGKSI